MVKISLQINELLSLGVLGNIWSVISHMEKKAPLELDRNHCSSQLNA